MEMKKNKVQKLNLRLSEEKRTTVELGSRKDSEN